MKIFAVTTTTVAIAALVITASARPASAVIFGTAEASAELARSLGARRAVFYVEKGQVIAEDWMLPGKGWPKKQAHEAIRRITGTKGAFAKREAKGGNEWLTTPRGITAVLAEGATTEAFTIARRDYEYKAKGRQVMVYLPGLGLIHQAPSPQNVALIKTGMEPDTVAAILGPWALPTDEMHDHDGGEQPPMTWNRNGKPAVRLIFKGGKVARVEKL